MATSDGYAAVKATKIVDTALALLVRESVLGNLVWRNAGGDFRGNKDDTISIRLPAYAKANKRELRSSDARQRSKLHERKVDVTLTHDLQVDIPLTDEEITLDIRNLSREVIAPSVAAIVRGYEQEIADLMSGATYAASTINVGAKPYDAAVDARKVLNDHQVPKSQRALVVGSALEAAILKSDQLARFDHAGDANALRRASIGMLAGFQVIQSEYLDPDEGFAFHRTAYAVSTRAPFVPDGVAWGESRSDDGYAIRVMQHLESSDSDGPTNVVFHDAWVGTNVVTDSGSIDADGKFEPAVDPTASGESDLFVRAVKLQLNS